MEQNCQQDKEYIFSFLLRSFFFGVIVLIFLGIDEQSNKEEVEVKKAFHNNEELICISGTSQKIISKNKGYEFEKNNNNLITNGDIVFDISRCRKRDN